MPTINAGGTRFGYDLNGEGETLVLLHEIGGSRHSWAPVIPSLAHRFRVLSYDQRGCGESDPITGEFSLATHIADLRTLIAALGLRGPLHLAGDAIGSALAVRYAATFPGSVTSLVLACPALSVSAERKDYLAARAAEVVEQGMAAVADGTLANSYPPAVQRDGAAYAAYRERFLANDPKSYAAINLAFANFDATPDLPRLRCPTLVLAGHHDTLRPPVQVRGVAQAIPGATYKEIDAAHIMPTQAPADMTTAMLAFYERVLPKSGA